MFRLVLRLYAILIIAFTFSGCAQKSVPFVEQYNGTSIMTTHTFYDDIEKAYYIINDNNLIEFNFPSKSNKRTDFDTPISFQIKNNGIYLYEKDSYSIPPSFERTLKINNVEFKGGIIIEKDNEIVIDDYYLINNNSVYVLSNNDKSFVGFFEDNNARIKATSIDVLLSKNYLFSNHYYCIEIIDLKKSNPANRVKIDKDYIFNQDNICLLGLSYYNSNLYFINRNGRAFFSPKEVLEPIFEWNSFYGDILYSYNPDNNELNSIKEFNKEVIVRYDETNIYTIDKNNNLYKYDIKNLNDKKKLYTVPMVFNCIENCKDIIVFYNYEKLDDNEYRHYLVSVFDTTMDKEIDLYNNNEE